jgi:hypothetical protein
MDVRPVDPRDVRWEVDSPVCRVYFWTGPTRHRAEEFELTGAEDVHEVLAWADENAPPDSTYTMYLVVEAGGEKGLLHLAGIDPTSAP